MPDVFGQELLTALAALKTGNIVVSCIVDITGREVAPANPGAEFGSTIVLAQLPPTGQPVAPGSTAQIVVSASLDVEATVEMPSLAGLTLAKFAHRARGTWARARQGDDAHQLATTGAIHGDRTA